MKDINDVWNKVQIPMSEKTVLVNDKPVKEITGIATAKAQPVSAFIKDDTPNKNDEYELVQKTIVNKLGKKKTIWIKKFYDNKNDGAEAYGQ